MATDDFSGMAADESLNHEILEIKLKCAVTRHYLIHLLFKDNRIVRHWASEYDDKLYTENLREHESMLVINCVRLIDRLYSGEDTINLEIERITASNNALVLLIFEVNRVVTTYTYVLSILRELMDFITGITDEFVIYNGIYYLKIWSKYSISFVKKISTTISNTQRCNKLLRMWGLITSKSYSLFLTLKYSGNHKKIK